VDVDKLKAAAAAASLKANALKVRAKIQQRGHATIFDALESIGATLDPMWHGEWTGPMLFTDFKGAQQMFMVEQIDHDEFDLWLRRNPQFTDEELQAIGRETLIHMAVRPVDYV